MNKKLAIIGAGGHGKVVGEIALLNGYKNIDFFDDRAKEIKKFPFNVIDTPDYLKENQNEYDDFFVAIGDNKLRRDKILWLKKYKMNMINLIHPKSIISKFCTLELGVCTMAHSTVNPGAAIREGVIINTSASIDHDCIIGDYSHISPNCSLSGNVKIGKFTHLGTGTSVHPGINIGENVKTGIGARIFKDILNGTIFKN
jgi:sugar O-acyltransferase (sialic acid O-acetyltransferase NeuD family)